MYLVARDEQIRLVRVKREAGDAARVDLGYGRADMPLLRQLA